MALTTDMDQIVDRAHALAAENPDNYALTQLCQIVEDMARSLSFAFSGCGDIETMIDEKLENHRWNDH